MTVVLMGAQSTEGESVAAPAYVAHVGPQAGTTSIASLNYPASGVDAGDLLIVAVSYEGPASNVATLSGWTPVPSGTASGGSCFTDLFYKVAAGTEDGTGSVGTIGITGGTTALAHLYQIRSSTGSVTIGSASSGADATSGTSYSATTGSVTTVADMLVYYVLVLNSTSTRTSRTLTQSGATLGTLNARFGTGTGLTQEGGDRAVTTGATAAFVNTYTLGTASTGNTIVLLLSETTATAHSLTASGASVATGAAALTQTSALAAAGSATTTGAAPLTERLALTAAGSVAATGVAALTQTLPISAAGTATADGTAALGIRAPLAATGAASSAGVAALTQRLGLTATGTSTATGSAELTLVSGATAHALTAVGAGTSAGAASLTSGLALTGAAVSTTAGTAALAGLLAVSATGEASTSGSAVVASTLALSAGGVATATGGADLQIYTRTTPRPNTGTTTHTVILTSRPNAGITYRP